jgi:BirA family biotin operon repressor/biotin-[acetyl-CoA-carboxylase] ligase
VASLAGVDEVVPGREPLAAEALRREVVRPGGLWTELTVLAETGSTNADLAAGAAAGAPEGTVLLAERQHAGRGRLGRTWTSPPGAGLILSFLLRPGHTVTPTRYGWLPLLAGTALVAAVRSVAGVDAALKWPNDLLVGPTGTGPAGGRGKCAGILAELVPGNAAGGVGALGAVVGIGLNVTLRTDELPRPDATSLALAGAAGARLDRGRLLVALLAEVAERYRRFRVAAGDPERSGLRAEYRSRCDTVGRAVRVELPDRGLLTGTAVDVDTDGRLVVAEPTGGRVTVAAGDVVHVRPGPG